MIAAARLEVAHGERTEVVVDQCQNVQLLKLPVEFHPVVPNRRLDTRTPQQGVEVERKWARSDYYQPGTRNADKLVQINSTTT